MDRAFNNAIAKVTEFFEEETARQVYQQWFKYILEMPGVRQWFKRVASASDKEQLMDYLAEVRYALIFAGLGFEVEIEPLGKKGPDLKVSRDDNQALIEVKRFKKVFPGPPELDLSNEQALLSVYGDSKRDIRKVFSKILDKFRQVTDHESIIAIWNDDEDMEELEVGAAVKSIRGDAYANRLKLPSGLSFVLYGSKWVGGVENKQLFCFPI